MTANLVHVSYSTKFSRWTKSPVSGPGLPAGAQHVTATLAAAHPLSGNRASAPSAHVSRSRSAPPLIAIISLAIAACATVEPPRPEQPRTTIVTVKEPIPVPCFDESERPVHKPLTPIDIDHATVDQMAAAIAADDLNDQDFAREVDALFLKCMRRIADGTATQPVGGKP